MNTPYFERNNATIKAVNMPEKKQLSITWLLQCYGHCICQPFKKYTPADFSEAIKTAYNENTPATKHALQVLKGL